MAEHLGSPMISSRLKLNTYIVLYSAIGIRVLDLLVSAMTPPGPGGGVLSCMGHIGMCRCEGYGFQAVYSSIGYINQSVWV